MKDRKRSQVFTPRRALVIVKQTMKAMVDGSQDDRLKQLLDADSPDRDRIIASDSDHRQTLEHVVDSLSASGITCRCIGRTGGEHFEVEEDMVVTIGGDGTFLSASHSIVSGIPVLGVNSAPRSSHGHYCLTDRAGFDETLAGILAGSIKPYKLSRLRLSLDEVELPVPILNEVLIAHRSPAGTTRYRLKIGMRELEKKSSGLIITTASGTTGLNLSAGGKLLPITAKRFAYSTLAPFLPPGASRQLVRGTLSSSDRVEVVSEMVEGALYLDGAHTTSDFPRGSRLSVDTGAPSLNAFVDRRCHDRYS